MLDAIIGRWRLWRLCRTYGVRRMPASSPYATIVLQRPAARDWLARRGIHDIRAVGPSSPPRC